MSEEIKIFLELSEEVQVLLERQGIDLYAELQQEVPSLHVEYGANPWSPEGSRDIVTILYATAAVITALTPTLLGILRAITPPDRAMSWEIDELETRSPDGIVTIQRKLLRAQNEQRPWPIQTSKDALPSSPDNPKDLLHDNAKDEQS